MNCCVLAQKIFDILRHFCTINILRIRCQIEFQHILFDILLDKLQLA